MKLIKKNIVILTQSVYGGNYGGLMQAYALQRYLRNMGHTVVTNAHQPSSLKEFELSVKETLKKVLNYTLHTRFSENPTKAEFAYIKSKFVQFPKHNINVITGHNPKKYLRNYDAYIVGSDQVWRKDYSNIKTHLLSFTGKKQVTRISYAASFGKDNISDYDENLLAESAKLARRFDAISVREATGINVCREHWGIEAVQLIDPTMLLHEKDYQNLVENDIANTTDHSGIFTYLLDSNKSNSKVITKIASILELSVYSIMPKKYSTRRDFRKNPTAYVLPTVSQWIKNFMDAKFVVTDSFHGCVFSIIFNKPFVAIGNKERGLARFTSLLKIFGLENRLVSSIDDINPELLSEEIDWDNVNSIKKREQKRSFDYLKKHLKVSL